MLPAFKSHLKFPSADLACQGRDILAQAMKKERAQQILGVRRKSSKAEIREAYLGLIRHAHPDVSMDKGATEQAALLNEAYEVLLKVFWRPGANVPFLKLRTKHQDCILAI